MKKFLVLLATMFFITGCAMLDPFISDAADKASEAVIEYCDQLDSNARVEFRAKVNEALPEGYGAEITCPSDA